jgi:hypothetical protein
LIGIRLLRNGYNGQTRQTCKQDSGLHLLFSCIWETVKHRFLRKAEWQESPQIELSSKVDAGRTSYEGVAWLTPVSVAS